MNGLILRTTLAVLFVAQVAAAADSTVPADKMPGPLQEVGYDQRLGEQLPLDLPFRDEAGRPVKLGDYFGRRPVVMIFAYYHCPMLCDLVVQGTTGSLKALTLDVGKDFDVVVVSIDPKETPEQAKDAKRDALAHYGRTGTDAGWHFLTGPQQSILQLTQAAGFRYVYDKERNEYAHAAGVMIATPGGRISRYLYGIEYAPRDVRLALIESSEGRIGSLADQLLLYCFHYDPVYGKYSAMTMNILRLGAIVTVLGLGLLIVLLKRRERVETGPLGAA